MNSAGSDVCELTNKSRLVISEGGLKATGSKHPPLSDTLCHIDTLCQTEGGIHTAAQDSMIKLLHLSEH